MLWQVVVQRPPGPIIPWIQVMVLMRTGIGHRPPSLATQGQGHPRSGSPAREAWTRGRKQSLAKLWRKYKHVYVLV